MPIWGKAPWNWPFVLTLTALFHLSLVSYGQAFCLGKKSRSGWIEGSSNDCDIQWLDLPRNWSNTWQKIILFFFPLIPVVDAKRRHQRLCQSDAEQSEQEEEEDARTSIQRKVYSHWKGGSRTIWRRGRVSKSQNQLIRPQTSRPVDTSECQTQNAWIKNVVFRVYSMV